LTKHFVENNIFGFQIFVFSYHCLSFMVVSGRPARLDAASRPTALEDMIFPVLFKP